MTAKIFFFLERDDENERRRGAGSGRDGDDDDADEFDEASDSLAPMQGVNRRDVETIARWPKDESSMMFESVRIDGGILSSLWTGKASKS